MVIKKILGLAILFGTETSYVYKLKKAIIVDKYENFMLETFWVVISSFESLNNS